MNELLISRLRTARLDKNMKQQDVADILGIKANTLSNWEKGRTEPDIDTFVKLCDIYDIDCASLLADVYTFKRIKSDISLAEFDYIKKYRVLDSHGKEMVDFTLDKEYERIINEQTEKAPIKQHILTWDSIKAAHNDHADEPDEQVKMQEDLNALKRPN